MTQVHFDQELAVLKHRVKQLEDEPPRVRTLEQEVGVIKNTIDGLKNDMAGAREELHAVNLRLAKTATSDDVRAINRSVIKIMAYGTATLSVLGAIATLHRLGWLPI